MLFSCARRVIVPGARRIAVCAFILAGFIASENVARATPLSYALHGGATTHAANLYVSPRGNDGNSGLTSDHPLATIQDAQKVVRQWISRGMTRNIVVYLENGTYRLTSPLEFGARDSGNHGHKVIWRNYPGASPVLSGGTAITGWTRDKPTATGRIRLQSWSASAKGYKFLQLYGPNGRISPARTPPFRGRLYTVPGTDTVQVRVPDNFLLNWNITPLTGVQVVMQYTWRQLRFRIASISPDENGYRWIVAKKPDGTVNVDAGSGFGCCAPHGTNPVAKTRTFKQRGLSPIFLEYGKQFMTNSSFWLDAAANKVEWIPTGDLKPNKVKVIAPTTQTLLTVDGASNLTFYGLQFAYTTWLRPAKYGLMQRQGGFRAERKPAGFSASGWPIWYVNPGAVSIQHSSRILFERDAFRDLGANGIVLGAGTRNIKITDSIFKSISDTGIFVGSTQDPVLPKSKQNINTTIANNVFEDMGVDYATGSAINATYPDGLFVEHNWIKNVANIAINLGYVDNLPPHMATSLRDVQIVDNRIDHACLIAADCGAIHTKTNFYYSTSKSHPVPRSTIRGNYITNVNLDPFHAEAWPVKGIYLDNHTNGLLVTKNECKNVAVPYGKPGVGQSEFVDNQTGDPNVIRHAGLLPAEKSLATMDLSKASIGGDGGPR